MLNATLLQMGFWTAWLVIPALFELVPALRAWGVNHFIHRQLADEPTNGWQPRLTVIVPVYNSADTLAACLRSVANSTYPTELITVLCVNNQSTDDSQRVFQTVQGQLPGLQVQWLEAEHGKARALNTAIYASTGEIIVNIDSDGTLAPEALANLVQQFQLHPEIQAQTGTILSNRHAIASATTHRLLRLNEYLEYTVAFLAGRTIESRTDQLFTMSGAFSPFRRSALVQTRLYNEETVGEDTEMTFQIRYFLSGRVTLCPNAVFYVEPISSWNELYVQRQRWQRGEIEVVRSFMAGQLGISKIFTNFLVRRLLVDHTVAFLKVIWFFAILVLIPFGYSPVLIACSMLAMYLLYLFIGALNFSNVLMYLRFDPAEQRYCRRHWWVLFTLPVYNLVVSFFRVMGIINAMLQLARWAPASMTKEAAAIRAVVKGDLQRRKEEN